MRGRRLIVAPKNVKAIAPALTRYTDDRDVWCRTGLGPRERNVVTLSVLTPTGKATPLRSRLGHGLTHGITLAEVARMTTHLAFHLGW